MTVSGKLTEIASKIRHLYDSQSKYSLDDISTALDGLTIRNFIVSQSLDLTKTNGWNNINFDGLTVDIWNKYLVGKSITISFDAEWDNFVKVDKGLNRFFFEVQTVTTDGQRHWNGAYYNPDASSGKETISSTVKLSDLAISKLETCVFWDELNPGAHLKATNFKLAITI